MWAIPEKIISEVFTSVLLFVISSCIILSICIAIMILFKTTLNIILNNEFVLGKINFKLPFNLPGMRKIRKEIFKIDVPLRVRKSSIFPSFSSPEPPTFSYNLVIIVLAKKRGEEETLVIEEATPEANSFYGFDSYSQELIGKSNADLMNCIQKWMNSDNYQAFLQDKLKSTKNKKKKRLLKRKYVLKSQ